jgi:hypothetical protein
LFSTAVVRRSGRFRSLSKKRDPELIEAIKDVNPNFKDGQEIASQMAVGSFRSRAAPHIGPTICKKHTFGVSKSLWIVKQLVRKIGNLLQRSYLEKSEISYNAAI